MMREVPECLNRRYKAVDDLIQQLSWSVRNSGSNSPVRYRNESADPGIKLMCDFWNILKEDPECDLKKQVKRRMGLTTSSTHTTYPQDIRCYQIADKEQPKWKDCAHKIRSFCCQRACQSCDKSNCSHRKLETGHCQAKSKQSQPGETPVSKTPQSVECCNGPLNKALCSVNGAATFESQCNNKINDLIITQLKLVQQIEILEMREKDGVKLLKKADCMWSCMEESYKKRLRESTDRQNSLIKQVREIEASNLKWRKSRKDIESQIASTKKKTQCIDEQIAQKKADLKFLTMEIEDFKKRTKNTKAEVANTKKRMETMKHNSELKVSNFSCEMCRLQKLLSTEHQNKIKKEKSGNKFVKEARQELQQICRVLLKKRLENEDRRAEKAALLEEIDLLNITMDQCKNRCKLKQDTLIEDITKLDQQIATYQAKCVHCNQCTDTNDVRRFCSDCPRCNDGRDCLYEGGFCSQEKGKLCVCMTVKEKFLDNVFDNMYTVLERQSKNAQGKHVAESIMECLKHSRNGKLNTETKILLQDFILSTLRKNLNLTIVGGAVKTRCELEPETYDQLMLCLKKVTPEKEPKAKVDKSTEKKDPCKHWRGQVSECHCPYGPKDCACSKRAPPVPPPPKPDAPEKPPKRAAKPGEKLLCPHKVKSAACGPDCGAFDALMKIDTEMSEWRPDPCSGPACSFKNVRAVQCILGPEVLNRRVQARPYLSISTTDDLDKVITTSCSKSCLTDCKESNIPRERIIEEVMGRYLEVSPIQKVTSRTSGNESFRRSFESYDFTSANNIRHIDEGSKSPKSNIIQAVEQNCDVRNTNNKRVKKFNDRLTAANYKKLEPKTAKFNLLVDSSQTIVLKDKAEIEMLKRERKSFICNRDIDCDVTHGKVLKITSDPDLAVNTETKETSFIVILDSKFYAPNNKISASTISFTSIYSTFNISDSNISGETSGASYNDDVSSVGYLIRNIDICNAAENLIKEVLVSESKANNCWGPEVEWMTISSFISTLERRSIYSCSNLSNDEVELINITLEAKKSFNKEKSINKFNKLLNDTLLEKVKENLIKSLNTYNQGSQCTCNEITKPLDTANIVSENKDELISDPPIKKTKSHNKCCQYFLQSVMNLARNSSHKINLFDQSMNFRKIVKITLRKPVNWFKYTSAYMTSTSTTSSSSASEVV